MLSIDGKTLRNVFVKHFLAEVLQHADVFSQLVVGQMGKDFRRRSVVIDKPVVVIQRDYAVSQIFQNLFRRQITEIIITAAPDHNYHHGHGNGKRHGRQIKYLYNLKDISHQHKSGQGGDCENRPILPVNLLVRAFADSAQQRIDAKDIGNDNATEQKDHIQRPIGNADMIKTVCVRQPLDVLVEKAMPVKKYRRKGEKTDCKENPQKRFRRSNIAVDINKPAITQRQKCGSHIFHSHRRHGSLHGRCSQFQ